MALLDPETLSPPYRLALAYAPARARDASAALLCLDERLARIGDRPVEPIVHQIRLAWWRDQFLQPAELWAKGEPLLAALGECGFQSDALVALVDGWEAMLVAEPIDAAAVGQLARGRAMVWQCLARSFGKEGSDGEIRQACSRWSAADAWAWGGKETDLTVGPDRRLPRVLRSLTVIDALAGRSLRLQRPMLDGPAAMVLAVRTGIFGR
ncbi:squalene/phytoene synthase family protein [Parerythrobacter aurantius]|uniref:squalene/phytoene synthase family protein n=1 Tax=Parerythrobacter aurantius TaxID=3127706 RepID=UPI003251310F